MLKNLTLQLLKELPEDATKDDIINVYLTVEKINKIYEDKKAKNENITFEEIFDGIN